MWIYFILMLFLIFCSAYNGRGKFKLCLSGTLLAILMGFKNVTVGNDTPNYIEFFLRLKNMSSFVDNSSRFEKGFQIYTKIIGMLFDSYQALFIISAVFCIACICFGIYKNSKNWQYSLFLFVGLRFYYFFLSGLRQSIAVSIIFVAYVFLKENRKKLFIILVLLASTFHFSAWIFLLALPLSKFKLDEIAIPKILLITFLIYVLFNPILSFFLSHMPIYYSHYLVTKAASANNLADFINAIIPCLFLLVAKTTRFNLNKDEENIKNNSTFIYSDKDTQMLFLLISAGLSFIATRASILDRMVQYYWIFSIITIPNIIFSIKDKRTRTIWYLIITSFVIVYNLTILLLRPEWNTIVPYSFFW